MFLVGDQVEVAYMYGGKLTWETGWFVDGRRNDMYLVMHPYADQSEWIHESRLRPKTPTGHDDKS